MTVYRWLISALFLLAGLGCLGGSGDRLYVTSGATDRVYMLDAVEGAVLDSLSLDPRLGEMDEPHGIAVAPDRTSLYVTVSHGEPTLWKFELPTNRLVGRTKLGLAGAARIGLTPDGLTAFIPDYYRDGGATTSQIAVVNLFNLDVAARLDVCAAPHDAAVSPDGALVAVTCTADDEVVYLDRRSFAVRRRVAVGDERFASNGAPVTPLNAVWSANGTTVLVTLHRAARVIALEANADHIRSVEVGRGPAQLALSPDSTTLVVANRLDQSVSVIDVPTLREQRRVPLDGPHPHGVTFAPDGRIAYVTYEGTPRRLGGVIAVDVATGTVRWRREVGAYTLGVIHVAVP